MMEIPRRLPPTTDTLRQLHVRSGNRCAFPNCGNIIIDAVGTMVSQICHIEAAMPGGERFNPSMSNEQRRAYSNLMLMCYEHHRKTNDVTTFTVEMMQNMKAAHESRFYDPGVVLSQYYADTTLALQPVFPRNLKALFRYMDWGLTPTDEADLWNSASQHIKRFARAPDPVRDFTGGIAARIVWMGQNNTIRGTPKHSLWVRDVEGVFRLNPSEVRGLSDHMEKYGIAYLSDDEYDDHDPPNGVRLISINDWYFWEDVAGFCSAKRIDIRTITVGLDFSILDE